MKAKDVEKHIRGLLTDETALTPIEAARILGVRDRDVRDFLQPSFYANGRPKYIAREVFRVRDRMVEASQVQDLRNRRMVRGAVG